VESPGAAAPIAAAQSSGQEFDFTHGGMTLAEVERRLILAALENTRGNVSLAAKLLGINRGALRYRIERHGLESHAR
jgi:DNA-binding protein Fis